MRIGGRADVASTRGGTGMRSALARSACCSSPAISSITSPSSRTSRFVQRLVGTADRERIAALLDDVDLRDRARPLPPTLSGGEAARAGLAVALANQPDRRARRRTNRRARRRERRSDHAASPSTRTPRCCRSPRHAQPAHRRVRRSRDQPSRWADRAMSPDPEGSPMRSLSRPM